MSVQDDRPPDYLIVASAKAHHAMMIEIADEFAPDPNGVKHDAEKQWSSISAENRQKHYDEAKRVLLKWWPDLLQHFAGSIRLDASAAAVESRAAEEMRALLTEIAIPSLQYCEEKYGHDDQARLNLEAGIGRAQP